LCHLEGDNNIVKRVGPSGQRRHIESKKSFSDKPILIACGHVHAKSPTNVDTNTFQFRSSGLQSPPCNRSGSVGCSAESTLALSCARRAH
jgi:hypothetical protein